MMIEMFMRGNVQAQVKGMVLVQVNIFKQLNLNL